MGLSIFSRNKEKKEEKSIVVDENVGEQTEEVVSGVVDEKEEKPAMVKNNDDNQDDKIVDQAVDTHELNEVVLSVEDKVKEEIVPGHLEIENTNKKNNKPKRTPRQNKKQPENIELTTATYEPVEVTFFGFPIRKFKKENKWYFVVEDVIKTAADPSTLDVYKQLKSKNGSREEINKLIYTIPYIENVEGGGADIDNGDGKEDTNAIGKIECAKGEDVVTILGMLKKQFPGPIIRWIGEQSQVD